MTIPEQTRKILEQAQMYQQQLQMTLTQKETLELQQMEIKKALEELRKSGKDTEVYKIMGPILIKDSPSEVERDLEGKLKTLEEQLKTLTANEKRLEGKRDELRGKLSGAPEKKKAEAG